MVQRFCNLFRSVKAQLAIPLLVKYVAILLLLFLARNDRLLLLSATTLFVRRLRLNRLQNLIILKIYRSRTFEAFRHDNRHQIQQRTVISKLVTSNK